MADRIDPVEDRDGDGTVRGYSAIGIWSPKTGVNVGTLVRSARCFDADFVFTIGRRYQRQASSLKHERHIPILHFDTEQEWKNAMPTDCRLVCVEIAANAHDLTSYVHPERAVYLLGSEDSGIPEEVMRGCEVVRVPTAFCLNVASTGTVVLYDRLSKANAGLRRPRSVA